MVRQIIHIDEEKCNGCGLCANACHEGAIDIVDGKAKLVRENFCDGFGDCLPGCPMGAITFENREAPAYDEGAVKAAKESKAAVAAQGATSAKDAQEAQAPAMHMCPGSMSRDLRKGPGPVAPAAGSVSDTPAGHTCPGSASRDLRPSANTASCPGVASHTVESSMPQITLQNWPVQIKLAPVKAPYFDGADLLIAADCTAYAYCNFHRDFLNGRVTLIGCPKLDSVDYSDKLSAILANNDIKSVTLVRMEVPCCGGLEMAMRNALADSGKFIPSQVVTVGIEGNILR